MKDFEKIVKGSPVWSKANKTTAAEDDRRREQRKKENNASLKRAETKKSGSGKKLQAPAANDKIAGFNDMLTERWKNESKNIDTSAARTELSRRYAQRAVEEMKRRGLYKLPDISDSVRRFDRFAVPSFKPDAEREYRRAENMRSVRRNELKSMTERYGINPDTFDENDLKNWAQKHNFEYFGGDIDEYVPKREGTVLGLGGKKITSVYDENALPILRRIAEKNTYTKQAERQPVRTSLKTIAAAPSRGIAGLGAAADDAVKAARGKQIDTDSEWHRIGNDINEAREIISSKHASKWFGGNTLPSGQNIGQLAYNIIMSAGDSASVAASGGLLGLGSGITSGIMASSAAADAIVENKRRGLSDKAAVKQGIASGAIEILTEKVSLDSIMKEPKTIVKGLMKSFAAEGSEEIASNVLNKAMDSMFNGSNAQISLDIKNYMSSGLDKKEAIKRAVADSLTDDVIAGFAGGISGMGMSGVYQGINAARTKMRKNANDVNSNSMQIGEKVFAEMNADDVRNKIQENEKGKYVQAEQQVTTDSDDTVRSYEIMRHVKNNVMKGHDLDIILDDGEKITITGRTAWKLGDKGSYNDKMYLVKGNASGVIDEIVQTSKLKAHRDSYKEHSGGFAANGFDYRKAYFRDLDGKYYRLSLSVGVNDAGKEAYNIGSIKEIPFPGQTVAKKGIAGSNADSDLQNTDDKRAVSGSKTVSESNEYLLSRVRALNDRNAYREKVSSDTTIPQNANDVNSNFMQNSEKVFGAVNTEAAERFKAVRPRYFEVIDGISKKLSVTTVIDSNIEGKDGYWNPRTRELHINENAENPINVILKHEITHVIEGSGEYGELVDFMKTSFADEWASRRLRIADAYERINMRKGEAERLDISDNMLDSETMAEFAQKFNTDSFIERVAAEKPGLITKVRNFIRNVLERIKGVFSRNELSDWEQAEKKWENAAHAAIQNGGQFENDGAVRDAVNNRITADDVKSVQSVGRKSINDFTHEDTVKTENFARKYFREMGVKSPFFRTWFGDWRANDATPVHVANEKSSARGVTRNADTGWDINISGKVFNETKAHNHAKNINARPYLEYINNIVENAVLLDSHTISNQKSKSANSAIMHSLYAIADMGNGKELLKLYVEELNDVNSDGTIKRAYQLQNIENQQLNAKGSGTDSLAQSFSTADTYTVSQLFNLVKSSDKNFKPNDASKVVNEDGTPKVVYHGTGEKFTVFDRTKTKKGNIQGMFFSPWDIDAGGYGENVGKYYIYLNNPADEGVAYKAYNMFAGQENAGAKAREYLEKLGYDGVNNNDEEYIVFNPNQIKSATDNIGTFDRGSNDIRYMAQEPPENEQKPIRYDRYVPKSYVDMSKAMQKYNENAAHAAIQNGGQFENAGAVRDAVNNRITADDVKSVQSVGRKSINDFTHEDTVKTENFARKYFREMGVKSPFFRTWFGDWRANDATPVKTVAVETIDLSDAILKNGDYHVSDTDWTIHVGKTLREETKHYARGEKVSVKALTAIKDILDNAILLDTEVSGKTSKNKTANTAFMHKLYCPIQYDNKTYIAKVSVEEFLNTSGDIERKAYHLQNIKIETADGHAVDNLSTSMSRSDAASIGTVSQLFNLVKSSDKNFKPKDASKVVNEDGTPKVVYRGTGEKFTVFDYGKIGTSSGVKILGDGFYFSDNSGLAKGYGDHTYECHIDIKNPYYATEQDLYNIDAARLERLGYDGVILNTPKGEVYSVFNPNQIKSALVKNKSNPLETTLKIETDAAGTSFTEKQLQAGEKSLKDIFMEMNPQEREKTFGNLREGYELDTDLPEKLAEMPEEWSEEMKMTALAWRKIRERHGKKISSDAWKGDIRETRDFLQESKAEQERYRRNVDTLNGKITGKEISPEIEIGKLRKYQKEKDYPKAAAAADRLLRKMQSDGNSSATPDVIEYLDAETKFEMFLNRADALVDKQIDEIEKRKPSLAKEIRAEAEDARKVVKKAWGENAAAKSKGKAFEQIKKHMESEEMPDDTPKQKRRKGPPKKKSAIDRVYDKYKIKHIDTVDMQRVRETFDTISRLNSKEDLIKLITEQSKERKTQTHGIKKALEGQEIVFLKDIAVQQLFNTITDTEGASLGRKISTFQTESHLLNWKTMIRNVTSNTAFSGTNTVASWVATPVDKFISILTHKRTVGTEKFSRSNYKSGAERATKQYIDIALAVDHSGKGKYDVNSAVRTFKNKTLGTFERAMGYGLQVTDEWQKGIAEDRVRKSLEKLKECGFTDKEINEIAEYEAKYRTFQDTTAPSQFMTKLKEAFNVIGIKDFGLGDIIQKYTQVPGTIISRSAEFTPLGYVKALNGIAKVALRRNEMSALMQRNIAMSIGRATTGTGLIMLFSVLSKLGIFVGDDSGDDSKELQKLKKAEGISGFQINLSALERLGNKEEPKLKKGDVLESIGFLEPLNVEMAIGYELSKRKDFSIKSWANLCTAQVFEQIAEIPAMQSLRNFQNTIDYGGNCVDIAIGIFASGATGFISSVVRQNGNFLDPIQRNPYKEETPLKKGIEQIKAAIPFVRESVPASITPYGEEKQAAKGFFNNFLNPGYASVYQPGDISEELYRMAKISSDVLPHVPASKFTIDGREFRPYGHDYEEYSKAVGARTHVLLKGAIEHGDYANLSDKDKAVVLASLAKAAESEAQAAYSNHNLKEVQKNTDTSVAAITVVGQKKFTEKAERFSGGENISAILNGVAKCVNVKTDTQKKTSDSQKMRVYGYLETKVAHGKITKEEARRQFNEYLAGNLEMPVFDTYTKEVKSFSEMTIDQKKSKITSMFNKYEAKEITEEEYINWRNDFLNDKVKVEVNNYVFDDYSDCDDATREKLLKKLQKRAYEEAEGEVKKAQEQ